MRLLLRHPAPLALVLSACASIAAVFMFARPELSPAVRGQDDMTVLTLTRRYKADDLIVLVGPKTGEGSFEPRLEPYDERFGNVMVTYGGRDEQLLERVEAAVDSLR